MGNWKILRLFIQNLEDVKVLQCRYFNKVTPASAENSTLFYKHLRKYVQTL